MERLDNHNIMNKPNEELILSLKSSEPARYCCSKGGKGCFKEAWRIKYISATKIHTVKLTSIMVITLLWLPLENNF